MDPSVSHRAPFAAHWPWGRVELQAEQRMSGRPSSPAKPFQPPSPEHDDTTTELMRTQSPLGPLVQRMSGQEGGSRGSPPNPRFVPFGPESPEFSNMGQPTPLRGPMTLTSGLQQQQQQQVGTAAATGGHRPAQQQPPPSGWSTPAQDGQQANFAAPSDQLLSQARPSLAAGQTPPRRRVLDSPPDASQQPLSPNGPQWAQAGGEPPSPRSAAGN